LNNRSEIGMAERRGVLLIVSSPSGAGKTSLTRKLIEVEECIDLSISLTTRLQRSSEIEGVHYHFVTKDEFERRRDKDTLLEWANVFGNFYGTPRFPVLAAIETGRDVLFDIDWQGARQIRKNAASDVVSVFILPPSANELMSRLSRRGQDSLAVIQKRLSGALDEVKHWHEYDHVIVNDDFDFAFDQLRSILASERQKTSRNVGIKQFVAELRADIASRLKNQPDK
jgi:guanylate kinase